MFRLLESTLNIFTSLGLSGNCNLIRLNLKCLNQAKNIHQSKVDANWPKSSYDGTYKQRFTLILLL